MAARKTQVVFDAWDTYVREGDDAIYFISFDVEAAQNDLTHSLPHCARVAIRIHEPGPSGGPGKPEHERLWEMEDQLCATLSENRVICRQVGRLTHGGYRVLIFQLDNWDTFRPPLEQWIAACDDYVIKVLPSEGWEFFNDCIRPGPDDWLFMADNSVIQNLLKAGSDPQKPHALEFVFLGEPKALKRVAGLLQEDGFRPLKPLKSKSDHVVMVKEMPLDVRTITSTSRALSRMAEEQGVKYDGWGAAVVQ
jgi:regulator of RNase E activity RraB